MALDEHQADEGLAQADPVAEERAAVLARNLDSLVKTPLHSPDNQGFLVYLVYQSVTHFLSSGWG